MTTKQESRLRMFMATRAFLKLNNEITQDLPHFDEFYLSLHESVESILSINTLLQNNIAYEKAQLREEIADLILDAANKAQAYASYVNDINLQGNTKLTRSSLKGMTDFDFIAFSKALCTNITPHLQNLTPYQVSQRSVTMILDKTQQLEQCITDKRSAQVEVTSNRQQMNEHFNQTDVIIEKIDGVIEIVRLTQPKFYTDYQNSRKVFETKSTGLALKGTITDAETGFPIEDVTISFCLQGSIDPMVVKKSAEKGGFTIKSLGEGVYLVSVSKIGYQSQTLTITVSASEMYVLDVKMVKG